MEYSLRQCSDSELCSEMAFSASDSQTRPLSMRPVYCPVSALTATNAFSLRMNKVEDPRSRL